MRVTVIGAKGFVGSAFVRMLSDRKGVELTGVTRANYDSAKGKRSDVVIEAACNSRKYLADEQPVVEFDASVVHRLRTLHDFPADVHLHISSVDVYARLESPEMTREDSVIPPEQVSRYGLHKWMAEQLVRKYASQWLIVRLAGMVGPGLRKNPVHDILNSQPLRIHPESQYQFLHTDEVASIVWKLIETGVRNEILNVCGEGLISPTEIARLAGRSLDLSLLSSDAQPRIVNISTEKIRKFSKPSETSETIRRFLKGLNK